MLLKHVAVSSMLLPSRASVSQDALGRVVAIALRVCYICLPPAPVFQLHYSLEM